MEKLPLTDSLSVNAINLDPLDATNPSVAVSLEEGIHVQVKIIIRRQINAPGLVGFQAN